MTQRLHPPSSERATADFNRDGLFDAFYYYSNDVIVRAEYDRNFDTKLDYFEWYLDGVISSFEGDDNFDGVIDMRGQYRFGQVVVVTADHDFNGVEDVTFRYTNGIVAQAQWQPNRSTNVLRLEKFTHGVKTEEVSDTDGDGVFDRRRLFDPFENPIE